MRNFIREHYGYFAQSHDFPVFFPCTLVNELADSLLLNSIDILSASFKQMLYDASGPFVVAAEEIFPDEVAMLCVSLP